MPPAGEVEPDCASRLPVPATANISAQCSVLSAQCSVLSAEA
jgi:hypothetical protein